MSKYFRKLTGVASKAGKNTVNDSPSTDVVDLGVREHRSNSVNGDYNGANANLGSITQSSITNVVNAPRYIFLGQLSSVLEAIDLHESNPATTLPSRRPSVHQTHEIELVRQSLIDAGIARQSEEGSLRTLTTSQAPRILYEDIARLQQNVLEKMDVYREAKAKDGQLYIDLTKLRESMQKTDIAQESTNSGATVAELEMVKERYKERLREIEDKIGINYHFTPQGVARKSEGIIETTQGIKVEWSMDRKPDLVLRSISLTKRVGCTIWFIADPTVKCQKLLETWVDNTRFVRGSRPKIKKKQLEILGNASDGHNFCKTTVTFVLEENPKIETSYTDVDSSQATLNVLCFSLCEPSTLETLVKKVCLRCLVLICSPLRTC